MVHFDVFHAVSAIFEGPLEESILKRARESVLLSVALHDIRSYTTDKHHITDDTPYGRRGRHGHEARSDLRSGRGGIGRERMCRSCCSRRRGGLFTQPWRGLACKRRIALLCGRYEGVAERVREHLATDELSIGDYVLTGGELAAMVIIDAVTRLVPGVLGTPALAADRSHAQGLLEGPHYTRPPSFRRVGDSRVLRSATTRRGALAAAQALAAHAGAAP